MANRHILKLMQNWLTSRSVVEFTQVLEQKYNHWNPMIIENGHSQFIVGI